MAVNYPTLPTLESQTRGAQAAGLKQGLGMLQAQQTGIQNQQALANLEDFQANAELRDMQRQTKMFEEQIKKTPEWQKAYKEATIMGLRDKAAKAGQSVSDAEMSDMQRQLDFATAIQQAATKGSTSDIQAVTERLQNIPAFTSALQEPDGHLANYVKAQLSGNPQLQAQANATLDMFRAVVSAPSSRASEAEQAKFRMEQAGRVQLERVKGEEARKTAASKPNATGLPAATFLLPNGEHVSGSYDKTTGRRYIMQGNQLVNAPEGTIDVSYNLPTAPSLKGKELTDLAEKASPVEEYSSLKNTFKPEYGGYVLESVGDAVNWAKKRFGDSSGQALWWDKFNRNKAILRHELFGTALTATEKPEFDKFNVDPGMDPDIIKSNVAMQYDIAARAARKLVGAQVAKGVPIGQVKAAVGPVVWGMYQKSLPLVANPKTGKLERSNGQ